ncbi:unnamed protein product [Lactuca saligna]|uniref:RRM domain-containing protein n=1 Tax=Lactuca saligna TaxID=75948 RepID=A0AA36EB26_LACSI|nr:unnamed protein product [Lactuca saligna]
MFVSNISDGVNKETIRKTFIKYGELTDVYMATKRDSKKKNFAFIGFRKVSKEWELEAALQSIKCAGYLLEVNITRFERKVTTKLIKGWMKKPQNGHRHAGQSFCDGRSFMEATTGRPHQPPPPPPPPPRPPFPKKTMTLIEGSTMAEWIHNPLNLNEETFSRIAGEFSKVLEPVEILPSTQDLSLGNIYVLTRKNLRINEEIPMEINRNIFNVKVMEIDFDWSPFPSRPYDISKIVEQDEAMATSDFVDIMMNLEEKTLEEGEIQDEVTGEFSVPVTMERHAEFEQVEVEESIGIQKPQCDIQVPLSFENNQVIDVETINDEYNHKAYPNTRNLSNLINKVNGHYRSIGKLATMGCFGPFPSSEGITSPIGPSLPLDPLNAQNVRSKYEAGNTIEKRRRIIRTSYSPDFASPINETRKTVEIGQILGFKIDNEDPILIEVMEEAGDIHIP